jgi:hypothetical protein
LKPQTALAPVMMFSVNGMLNYAMGFPFPHDKKRIRWKLKGRGNSTTNLILQFDK